jgi:hypothetical protein
VTTLRTEEWTFEVGPMISTGLINVFEGVDGDVVHATDAVLLEMGLTPDRYPEGVECETFHRIVPYAEFKDAVIDAGGSYAGTT